MRTKNQRAGRKLRKIRQVRGLTLRQVFQLSKKLASYRHNRGFLLPASRLSEIESSGTIPSIHRLYALAHVYDISLDALLALYGLANG